MNLSIKKVVTHKKALAGVAMAAALFCSLQLIATDSASPYKAQPAGSKITIHGDSTIHKWDMVGVIIGGQIDFGALIDTAQAEVPGLKEGPIPAKCNAIVPVRSVKSGHDIMDGLYQEALKEKDFPRITYTLSEMKLKPGHAAGKPVEFDTTGDLMIAGVTNKVSMPVKVENIDKTKIKITGTCPLKMTAFGIKPPAPNIGLGLMKCADDVSIDFEWTMAQPAPEKK